MSIIETYNATTSWTCPDKVTSVTVECYGPGGNGGWGEGSEGYAGGGGGGGAYASAVVAVSPGAVYTLSVGTAGSEQPTYFKDTATVKADCGRSGGTGTIDYGGSGGAGGSITNCVGSTKLAGQKGVDGGWSDGGAGGNAGGPAGGGGGGANGGVGAAPGGGGGGGYWDNSTGPGSGAAGRIILTYNVNVMGYTDYLQSLSRTPVTMVVLTMDHCGRTFGVSPCLASGEKCYNTFPTCKYKTVYLKQSKDYKFTSGDAPLPFKNGERPYLKSVKYLPTEIKDNLTVNARISVDLYDEADGDVGIDPYLTSRNNVPNTSFWKKMLVRNKNYKGRTVKVYDGFSGLAETDFQQKFIGQIDSIKTGSGTVTIEVVDLLKTIADVEVPPKLDIKLLNGITDADTEIVLTSVAGLDSAAGYVRVGDEVIAYSGIDTAQNKLTGCTRAAFSTTAEEHSASDKVQKCRYYAPANPFEILKDMLLTDAEIDQASVDTVAFDYWKTFPDMDIDFSALITEPTKLDKLYFEILDLIDCKSWVAEDLKITVRRNVPNKPGRAYSYLSDDKNIINRSMNTDLNEKSRFTRVLCYWDIKTIGKFDDVNSYNRLDIALDVDAESDSEYGDVIEKKIFCRWISPRYIQEETVASYVRNSLSRILFRYRDAMPIVDFKVEIKDMDIKTGQYAIINTDEMLDKLGNPVNDVFQIVKRERTPVNTVAYRALKLPWKRFAFIAPDGTSDYPAASDAEKEYGYVSDDKGFIGEVETAYYTW